MVFQFNFNGPLRWCCNTEELSWKQRKGLVLLLKSISSEISKDISPRFELLPLCSWVAERYRTAAAAAAVWSAARQVVTDDDDGKEAAARQAAWPVAAARQVAAASCDGRWRQEAASAGKSFDIHCQECNHMCSCAGQLLHDFTITQDHILLLCKTVQKCSTEHFWTLSSTAGYCWVSLLCTAKQHFWALLSSTADPFWKCLGE